MSDGARIDEFRRSNTGKISHEQIYLTYELSDPRAKKMKKELMESFPEQFKREIKQEESTFQRLFLLDDFSASGTSYLKYDEKEKELKGKIAGLYKSVFDPKSSLYELFDIPNLKSFLGGHKAVVRPVPIPNTAVKHSLADGSSSIGSARVGRRQPFKKAEISFRSFGFFILLHDI